MAVSSTTRRRLEAQGFTSLDDAALGELAPWMEFGPALCTTFMGLGTLLASPAILAAQAVVTLLGALFPRHHPFDLIYNHGVRRLTGTRPLPPNGPPRRFACAMATVWLVATVAAFQAGATTLGYVLGGLLTAVAALVTATHFCIPSLIYHLTLGRIR